MMHLIGKSKLPEDGKYYNTNVGVQFLSNGLWLTPLENSSWEPTNDDNIVWWSHVESDSKLSLEEAIASSDKNHLQTIIKLANEAICKINNEADISLWQVYDEKSQPVRVATPKEAKNILDHLVKKYIESSDESDSYLFKVEEIILPQSEAEHSLIMGRVYMKENLISQ